MLLCVVVTTETNYRFMNEQAKAELVAITALTEPQIEQWIKLYSYQQQQPLPSRGGGAAAVGSTSHSGGAGTGRQSASKRKQASSTAVGSPSAVERPARKKKSGVSGAAKPRFVELRCFQTSAPSQIHFSNLDTTLRERMDVLLVTLLRNELALPFAEPVNPKLVPGYAEIIKTPMDLGTIRTRVSRGFYDQRWEQMVRDVNLVWDNCFAYNRLDAEISKCANRLRCTCAARVCV